jgi:hypothetical protein
MVRPHARKPDRTDAAALVPLIGVSFRG